MRVARRSGTVGLIFLFLSGIGVSEHGPADCTTWEICACRAACRAACRERSARLSRARQCIETQMKSYHTNVVSVKYPSHQNVCTFVAPQYNIFSDKTKHSQIELGKQHTKHTAISKKVAPSEHVAALLSSISMAIW